MYAIKFTICSCSKKKDEILVKALMGVRDMGAVLGLTFTLFSYPRQLGYLPSLHS